MSVPVTSAAAGSDVVADALPSPVRDMIARELEPGERIEWCGQPNGNKSLRRTLPVLLFGVPWTAFAVFWTVMAARSGGVFGLFGLPFVGVGLLMLSSPWWARVQAGGSAYVITNHRIIMLEKQSRGRITVRSFLPHQVGELVRSQGADGSGDLTFSRSKNDEREATFTALDDVVAVERRVRDWLTRHP